MEPKRGMARGAGGHGVSPLPTDSGLLPETVGGGPPARLDGDTPHPPSPPTAAVGSGDGNGSGRSPGAAAAMAVSAGGTGWRILGGRMTTEGLGCR
jgi:hypothetical protein